MDGRRRGEARGGRGRPRGGGGARRAARRRQTGLGGVQGAVLEVANLALPRGSGSRGSGISRSDPGDARYVAERNQRVGRLGNILGRFASRRGESPGGESPGGESPGGDASVRSDRSDDSAEAARGAVPKKPPAFKKPSVPPPRPTPVFQFSNPLASPRRRRTVGRQTRSTRRPRPRSRRTATDPGLLTSRQPISSGTRFETRIPSRPEAGAGPSRAGVGGRGGPAVRARRRCRRRRRTRGARGWSARGRRTRRRGVTPETGRSPCASGWRGCGENENAMADEPDVPFSSETYWLKVS